MQFSAAAGAHDPGGAEGKIKQLSISQAKDPREAMVAALHNDAAVERALLEARLEHDKDLDFCFVILDSGLVPDLPAPWLSI